MINEILLKKENSVKQRLKRLILYINRRRGAKKSWKRRHRTVFRANKRYNQRCNSYIEKEHANLWCPFRKRVDFDTFRVSSHISGTLDPRIVPEDIYTADIEPTLINDKSVDYISNKSFYNHWFTNGIFPEDLFHKIEGQYFQENLEASNFENFKKRTEKIEYPVVLKPNRDSYGGENINFVKSKDELLHLSDKYSDFVLQKVINQHEFFNRYNSEGLNTVKVFMYRSVTDNKWHILSMALRMGKDGSLDNEAAGGISTLIKSGGLMNGYAIDKFGNKYFEHPNSKLKFNAKIPDYEELASLSHKITRKIFLTRIVGLDACYDNNGKWRMIEVNTIAQSIRFSQYGGQPFFGKFTEEVIEYCKKNHWALS